MLYLGTITVVSGSSVNNASQISGAFDIQGLWPRLLLVTPSSGATAFYIAFGSYDRSSVPVPTFAATTNDFSVGLSTSVQITAPLPPGRNTVVAIYGQGGGGAVSVYGLWGQAQS